MNLTMRIFEAMKDFHHKLFIRIHVGEDTDDKGEEKLKIMAAREIGERLYTDGFIKFEEEKLYLTDMSGKYLAGRIDFIHQTITKEEIDER